MTGRAITFKQYLSGF